ncbi:hypothetical protein ACFV1W_04250 [Kitasatospora sp. NPDC059648]|uniref:hypothetical protein n=1 Tax=Kitasatospora sp. NPDC059648 TaxID=3346894 RepID=UPI003679A8BA
MPPILPTATDTLPGLAGPSEHEGAAGVIDSGTCSELASEHVLTVSFSDLPKNSERVADAVERARRVRGTRRDGEDLCSTAEGTPRRRGRPGSG